MMVNTEEEVKGYIREHGWWGVVFEYFIYSLFKRERSRQSFDLMAHFSNVHSNQDFLDQAKAENQALNQCLPCGW